MVENVISSQNNSKFGLIGTKVGMSRVFRSDGESIPVTVIASCPLEVLPDWSLTVYVK